MPAPAVSVVIPTHDRAEQCRAAVVSALAQEPAPAEVLVCDNGSTDGTAAVLAELAAGDPRVRHLPVPVPTRGPGAPRNLGVRAARSEWVAFLDDDDAWLPGKLAAQLGAAASADLVATNARRASTGAPLLAGVPERPDHAALLRDNVLITSTVLVRRALVEAAGGFPEAAGRQGVEDYELWLDVAAAGARVRILPDPLVLYRDHGDDRFAGRGPRVLRQLAALHARRWARRPLERDRARAAASASLTWVRDGVLGGAAR